jgi:hypothetical protein
MKTKKLTVILMLVILTYASTNVFAEEYSFRKTKWGMSKQQVLASETLKPAQEKPNLLIYKTRLLENNYYIIYIFVDDKLVRSKYMLHERHSNKNSYIDDYNSLNAALTNKYGEPLEKDTLWLNDLYKDDRSNWVMAISIGHCVYFTKWETNESTIFQCLSGDNYKMECGVQYSSKQLKHLEKKQKEQQTKDAL